MKLFIFGIGGTGSRVLKSLTMLLAAGVKIQADEIIPIIIDTDAGAANKDESVLLMNKYRDIAQHVNATGDNFFKTRITQLDGIHNYTMNIGGATNVTFADYMQLAQLDPADRALANLLYSSENQKMNMDRGFQGNPNMGTTVLNQFAASPDFQKFGNAFQAGDAIFIISSIFGGTGASGFPLLAKNLRTLPGTFPSAAAIGTAPVGAITVQPYFNLELDKNGIDANTFFSKTKAALSYYADNLKEVNTLYYIGDTPSESYHNDKGGAKQKNPAHFVELASALAIIDFAAAAHHIQNPAGGPWHTAYKEFGIKSDADPVKLTDLEAQSYGLIARPLTEMTLAAKFMRDRFQQDTNGQVWVTGVPDYRTNVMNSPFYQDFVSFCNEYMTWLDQLADNHRGFAPFDTTDKSGDVFGLAHGIDTKSVLSTKKNYDLYTSYLNAVNKNKLHKKHSAAGNADNSCFLEHLYQATQKIAKDKIKL